MSGRGELIGTCLSGIKVGGYVAPQHRAVAAKVPDKSGQPEVVRAPGFECQSVEFSLVQGLAPQASDPHEPSKRATRHFRQFGSTDVTG